jgi:VWFA-related protein
MRVWPTWCVALICLMTAAPRGQADARQVRTPEPPGAPASSSGPDEAPVRIDAVVTDPQGRPILNLRATDFELLENGAPRALTAVELRTPARADSAAPASPIETEADEIRAARQPGTRVFAFFLDEFHVTPGETADRARAAVSRFVDEQLQPQDLAIVMRPLDAVTGIRFTRDRAALHAALAEFSGRKGDLTPRSAFEEQYIGRAPAAVAMARAQIVTAALRELTLRLGDVQADRGVVVLVSEGFARDTAPRAARLQDLQGVVRASSRFHLAVYTFNPGAPVANSPAETGRDGATLEWLAAQTGGRAVLQGDDLAPGFVRLAHDLAAYYAMTYRPAQADGRFHSIEVRAKRRNADVRVRPGYWAPLGGEWRALLAASSRAPMVQRPLHRSPFIDTWVGLAPDAAGRARMVITWEPRAGKSAPPQVVVVQARTTAGAELFKGTVTQVQSGSGAEADSARFDVPSGRVELDLSILDVQGKVLDTELRDFDVPDLAAQKRGPMLLFPEVVRARTMRDFRTAVTDPKAAPSSGRVFERGDRLLIRVPSYDSSGTAVQVSAKVLNEMGQLMRDIDPADGADAGGVAQFALPLSWLGPGQYLIELAGANANGTVKERVAFRVRG